MINSIKCNIKKVDKILHIADIHIRNWKRHKEYEKVFSELYNVVDSLPADSIVTIGGDIVHAKTDMSPELISMVSDLFNFLANRRPTIVICGNHDTNLNNSSRLDALTPIIQACNHPNLFYLRNSGLYRIGNIAISVMSLLDDRSKYITADKITNRDQYKYLIAMYHGTIANSQVDSGLTIAHGLDWDTFAGFDIALLGDIHKRQVLSEADPLMFYPSSLLQQNFGESFDGHGYALVDLTSDKIQYEFHDIANDYGYYTLDINDGVLPDNLPITTKTNVRLRARNTSSAELKRILATIRKKYRNADVLVQKVNDGIAGGDSALFGESLNQGDIRNLSYQNQLITEYLEQNHNIDSDTLASVIEINTKLNKAIHQTETVRNIVWKPKRFEFDNMFSYGEGNVVDFSTMNGTCGLFAPNHAGKSAVLDALCFCLFDHSFRASKAEQVLNRKKDHFWCKFLFELGGTDYYIEKKAHKYKSGPLKGKLRVDIDFWCINNDGETVSLNGEQRRDTDKIIQSYVGTFDDFILTALSLQQNNSNFVDKTQSERKELLANFLDLKIFDSLYDLANKESRSAVIVLEEYQKQDFETKLGDAERVKDLCENKYQDAQKQVDKLEEDIQNITEKLLDYNKQLQPCKADGLDINRLNQNYKESVNKVSKLQLHAQESQDQLKREIQQSNIIQAQLDSYKESFDVELYKEYTQKVQEKQSLDNTLSSLKVNISNKLSKLEKLKQHEYDPTCKYCTNNVFVKDAIETQTQLEEDKKTVSAFLENLNRVVNFIESNKGVQDQANEVQKVIKELAENKIKVERLENQYNHYVKDILLEQQKQADIQNNIQTYEENIAILENNKNINIQIHDLNSELSKMKIELSKANLTVKDLHAKIRLAEQTIQDCEKSILHMQELADNLVAYEAYAKAVCKDGIPYLLISKAVPYIQAYVNNILNQVIDFTVELETDGKNINVFICYDDTKWPLELSSGMEKFMSSLALRIALIKITNLPKPDFMAIDEGLGVLDSTNLNSMHTLFNYIKDIFRFSLVISHIDVVRDMVDNVITIDKKEEFSYINC